MFLKTLIVIALMFNQLVYVIAAEKDNPKYTIMVELSSGSKRVNYDEINDQLKRYHQIDGINYSPILGIDGIFIKKRLIFGTAILTSYNYLEKQHNSYDRAKISFSGLHINAKVGLIPFSSINNIFYPFVGLGLEYLLIETDMNYGIRCINCFFRNNHKYSIYDFVIIYGITYNRLITLKEEWPFELVIGIKCGRSMAITDNNWLIDNKKIQHLDGRRVPQFDPGSVFLKVHLGFILYNR